MIELRLKDGRNIVTPLDLANVLGEHLLIVDEKGKAQEGTDIPEEIHARFEATRELLYVDTRVFTALGLQNVMARWREEPFYCGVLQKRLASGSGKIVRGINSVCFDLSENPLARTDPIRPRRGRPLQIERARMRVAKNEEIIEKQVNVHELASQLREELGETHYWSDIQTIIDWAQATLEEASRLVMKGKKPGPAKGTRKPKVHIPLEARVQVHALDAFIKDHKEQLHRILKKTEFNDEGRPRLVQKNLKPKCDPDDWVGRYEDVMEETGLRIQQLFIPVSLLRHDEKLKQYRNDYRYTRQVYRKVGRQTAYCAAFDMSRPLPAPTY